MSDFGLVCEAASDAIVIEVLVRRVLGAAIDWLDRGTWEVTCKTSGLASGARFTSWADLGRMPVHWPRRRAHGHFKGAPGAPMALAARKALLHFLARDPQPDAVILVKDADDDPIGRCRGLEQA